MFLEQVVGGVSGGEVDQHRGQRPEVRGVLRLGRVFWCRVEVGVERRLRVDDATAGRRGSGWRCVEQVQVAESLLDSRTLPLDDPLAAAKASLRILTATEDAVVPTASLLRSKRPFHSDFSWLHLSDLHITADYGDARSDTAADLGRFLDDLPECLDQMHVEPDAIFFTGDVAQSGAEEEYEVAKEFFDHVQDCLPTRSRQVPLLMIPGNHDVTWSAINPARDLEIRRELKLHGDSHSILDKHGDYLSERQLNYREFSNKSMGTVTTPTADALGFTHTVPAPKRGVRVGIAGLNSSWLSTRDDLLAGTGAKPGDFGDVDLQRLHLSAGQMRLAAASLSNGALRH